MSKITLPRGRKSKYAEYEELLVLVKEKTPRRPMYRRGIGILVGKRDITAYLKVLVSHGAVYEGRTYKPKSYIEMKMGSLHSFDWEKLEDLFRHWQGKADRAELVEETVIPTFSEYVEIYLARAGMVAQGVVSINRRRSINLY